MSFDLRGFNYALEPLLRQRQWQLDALLARLGQAQAAVREAQEHLEALRARHEAQSREAARSLLQRLNPDHHTLCLQWLANLHTEILAGATRLGELEAERSRIRAQCLLQQQKLDVIELHREEEVADYTRVELGRLATEADRDWLARAAFRKSLLQSDSLARAEGA